MWALDGELVGELGREIGCRDSRPRTEDVQWTERMHRPQPEFPVA